MKEIQRVRWMKTELAYLKELDKEDIALRYAALEEALTRINPLIADMVWHKWRKNIQLMTQLTQLTQ